MGLFNLNISEQDVMDQTSILDLNKAYGPDSIPPRLIKEGGRAVTKLLARLFNMALQQCEFPKIWKTANVIPLHKKDDRDLVTNYHPVSLLNTDSKVFEKIVFKYVYNHLKDNFVLTDFKFGFLPGRSTVTQLIEV